MVLPVTSPVVFSVALRPSDGLPAHLAEDLLLQLGLNSAGREQKTDIWLESRYICCVTSITEDQARWGRVGGAPAVREEAPSSNYGILFDTTASFAPLDFSFSSSRFLLFSEPLLSQNAKGSLFKSHWQDWNLCGQVVVILKFKLCLNQGCFCLFWFFLKTANHLAGESPRVKCRWFLCWRTNWWSFRGSAPPGGKELKK